jgi:hypothetical protein
MDENNVSENLSKCSEYSDEKDGSSSVTIYEDECDTNYVHKIAKSRLTTSLTRSPLATLNKPLIQHNAQQEFANNQIPSTSKTPVKLNEIVHRRMLQKEPSSIDHFTLLSDELLLQIFQYLPKKALKRLAQVNSRFARVSVDDSLWLRIDLANRVISSGAFSHMLTRRFIFMRLALARIQSPVFQDIPAKYIESTLQYLDLSMASIQPESLAEILSTCRSLKKLSLEQLPLDINVCKAMAANRNLEVLNMAMCEGLTTECVAIMMVSLHSLTALNISWTQLSSEGIEAAVSLISPTIMRLNIAGCRRGFTDTSKLRFALDRGS